MNRFDKSNLFLISFFTFLFSIFINSAIAQASEQSSNPDLSKTVFTPLVAATLGFISNVLLDQVRKKSIPKKQLTYNLEVKKYLAEIDNNLKEELTITYKQQPAKNIYYIVFNLQNTGQKIIRENQLILKFINIKEILGFFYEPKPDYEAEIKEDNNAVLTGEHEKQYNLLYIKPGKQVGFHFIVSSANEQGEGEGVILKPYCKSSKDDEEAKLVEGKIKKAEDETYIIQRFITLLIMFILIPMPFEIPIEFSTEVFLIGSGAKGVITFTIASLIRMIILLLILPEIEPFSKVIVGIILRNFKTKT